MGRWRWTALVVAGVSLTACHTRAPDAEDGIRGGLTEGILAPLEDFNIRREEIPPLLATLDVYEKQVPSSCRGIELEVMALESFVGSDVDAVDLSADSLSLRGRAKSIVDDQAYGLVSDFTRDIIPFRAMVRRATGASAHDKDIRQAYRRGHLRRSYLKGIGFAMGCEGAAAPRFPQTIAAKRAEDREVEETTFTVLEVPPPW
ncbi:MAG: hypothetical protein AAGH41_00620 [Pseudomonadota bacterium]